MNTIDFLDLVYRDEGLSASQLRVLAYLFQKQEYQEVLHSQKTYEYPYTLPTVGEIASKFNWPRQTASSVVAKLAAAGYLTYERGYLNAKHKYLCLISDEGMKRKKLMGELAYRVDFAEHAENFLIELLTKNGYLEEGQDVLSVERHGMEFYDYDWSHYDYYTSQLAVARERIALIKEWLAEDPLPEEAQFIPGQDYAPFAFIEEARKEGKEESANS